MCVAAQQAAIRVIVERELSPTQAFALWMHAYHANRYSGISFVKKETIMITTRFQQRAVISAVRELVRLELLVVHAYASGGRGRSTEYLVLPGEWDLEARDEEDSAGSVPGIKGARGAPFERVTTESGDEKGAPRAPFRDNPGKSAHEAGSANPGKSQKGAPGALKPNHTISLSNSRSTPHGNEDAADSERPRVIDQRLYQPDKIEQHVELADARRSPAAPASDATPWWRRPDVPPDLAATLEQLHEKFDAPPPEAERRR